MTAATALKAAPDEATFVHKPSRLDSIAPADNDQHLSGIVHILTCGSVDDGKSTLIGRLLWDASDLPDDTRSAIAASAGADGIPDVSLLVDGLVAEREQGITIDIAWRYFDTAARRHVIIDSPGHEQYTRNMASGASHADVAIMLVDARHGVKRQTRRHAAILNLVGLKHVILAVNKMDLVGWSETRFREIDSAFRDLGQRFGFNAAHAVPVAARTGDNLAARSANMPWYDGPTLLEQIDGVPGRSQDASTHFRMPVQSVVRDGTEFRGIAGTVSSGGVRLGDQVKEALSGRQARVNAIVTMDGTRTSAHAGQAVVLTLDTDLDIARGAVLACPTTPPARTNALNARIVWLSDNPLHEANGLLLRVASDLIPVANLHVTALLDLDSMTETQAETCTANDIALASIRLARHAAIDTFDTNRETGSFVLVDALTGATLAGGIVADATPTNDAPADRKAFELTTDMLANGVCTGLEPDSAEFRRRAGEVAIILGAAGIAVELTDSSA